MDKLHPHIAATYQVVPQALAFGVEVSIPDTFPTVVSSFATKADAEAWIEKRKAVVAKGYPSRSRLRFSARAG